MSRRLRFATMDYSKEIGGWTLWYIPIFALVYVVLNIFINEPELNAMSFFAMALPAGRIFMFVLGIIAVYAFLEWSVNLGLTRKIFIRGMLMAGVIITIFITLVAAALSFLFGLMPWFGNGIPGVEGGEELFRYVGGYVLTTYLYFLGGFLISVGFYRGFAAGMGMIILNIVVLIGLDLLWSPETGGIIVIGQFGVDAGFAINVIVLMIIILALIVMAAILLNAMTRNLPVKIK